MFSRRQDGAGPSLTSVLARELQLQLLHLPDQQGDVLQHVLILQQELVHASLGLQPCRSLGSQLVLQQVNLQKGGEAEGHREQDREERGT